MSVEAGSLHHRIDIMRRVDVQNIADGEMTVQLQPFALNVAARVTPLSARELIAAQAVNSEVTARIKIRYRPGLDASMCILHRGLTYNIAGVLPDPDSGLEYITLPVSQGLNAG